MHKKNIISSGTDLKDAKKAMIMIHGRGADARDILGLASYFDTSEFALLAPEATNNTWYPYSFLAPVAQNEPWLSSAIDLVDELVNEVVSSGIDTKNIYLLGFSQGACLTLEYTARNAREYGGVIAFTGGLIGSGINEGNYKGSFGGTNIFIGSSDPDPHVPVQRVNDSAEILTKMGAKLTRKIYPNMGHSINQDEIEEVNRIFFK